MSSSADKHDLSVAKFIEERKRCAADITAMLKDGLPQLQAMLTAAEAESAKIRDNLIDRRNALTTELSEITKLLTDDTESESTTSDGLGKHLSDIATAIQHVKTQLKAVDAAIEKPLVDDELALALSGLVKSLSRPANKAANSVAQDTDRRPENITRATAQLSNFAVNEDANATVRDQSADNNADSIQMNDASSNQATTAFHPKAEHAFGPLGITDPTTVKLYFQDSSINYDHIVEINGKPFELNCPECYRNCMSKGQYFEGAQAFVKHVLWHGKGDLRSCETIFDRAAATGCLVPVDQADIIRILNRQQPLNVRRSDHTAKRRSKSAANNQMQPPQSVTDIAPATRDFSSAHNSNTFNIFNGYSAYSMNASVGRQPFAENLSEGPAMTVTQRPRAQSSSTLDQLKGTKRVRDSLDGFGDGMHVSRVEDPSSAQPIILNDRGIYAGGQTHTAGGSLKRWKGSENVPSDDEDGENMVVDEEDLYGDSGDEAWEPRVCNRRGSTGG